jgi:Clostripain family
MPENAAKPQKKDWAVLVYMVADDPQGGELLDQQANRELDRIVFASMGADRSKLHVAVQVDYRSQRDVWRRVIGEGSWRHPESDAADPETLYGFFRWAKEMCPADRYLLMFWGHSRSMFGLFTDADPWEYVAQTLTLPELRTALRAATDCIGRELDIVVFKDCYMSTLETAGELKGLATYLVASQSLVPIEGWPYSEMFGSLVAHKNDPKKAALQIIGDLEAHYADQANRDGFPSVPYALLDTTQVTTVNAALAPIAARLVETRGTRAGLKARRAIAAAAPRSPGDAALLDVHSMCRRLRSHPDMKEMSANLEHAVFGAKANTHNKLVLRHYPARSSATRAFGGVSLFYYPPARPALESSLVAGIASRQVYEALQITTSRWNEIAVEAMPPAAPSTLKRYVSDGLPELARQLLPLMVLDQLQNEGLLEQLQREAFSLTQSTIANLVNSQGLIGKPLGFGVGKPLGFGVGKSLGFGVGKPLGFVGKPLGFVGKPLGFGIAPGSSAATTPHTAAPATKPSTNGHRSPKAHRPTSRKRVKLEVVSSHRLAHRNRRPGHTAKTAAKGRRVKSHNYEVVKSA